MQQNWFKTTRIFYFLRRHETEIKGALPASGISIGPARLSAEETAQIQGEISISTFELLAANLNSRGHKVFAPWTQVEKHKENKLNDRVFVHEAEGVTGCKGEKKRCKMTIIVQDMLTLLSSELEVRQSNGDLIQEFRLRDAPSNCEYLDLPIALSQDGGQGSVKSFFHLVGVKGACSAFKARVPWMYEQASPRQKDKPNDEVANWLKAIELTDGWNDMNDLGVIKVMGSYCTVPWLSIPPGEIPLVHALAQDIQAVYSHRKGERFFSASQSEKMRLFCLHGSLVLLQEKNTCIGVRFVSQKLAGEPLDVIYSFKQPVKIDNDLCGRLKVIKFKVRVMICTDLLSLCAGLSCENEAPVICCICDLSPAEFKRDARNPTSPF